MLKGYVLQSAGKEISNVRNWSLVIKDFLDVEWYTLSFYSHCSIEQENRENVRHFDGIFPFNKIPEQIRIISSSSSISLSFKLNTSHHRFLIFFVRYITWPIIHSFSGANKREFLFTQWLLYFFRTQETSIQYFWKYKVDYFLLKYPYLLGKWLQLESSLSLEALSLSEC